MAWADDASTTQYTLEQLCFGEEQDQYDNTTWAVQRFHTKAWMGDCDYNTNMCAIYIGLDDDDEPNNTVEIYGFLDMYWPAVFNYNPQDGSIYIDIPVGTLGYSYETDAQGDYVLDDNGKRIPVDIYSTGGVLIDKDMTIDQEYDHRWLVGGGQIDSNFNYAHGYGYTNTDSEGNIMYNEDGTEKWVLDPSTDPEGYYSFAPTAWTTTLSEETVRFYAVPVANEYGGHTYRFVGTMLVHDPEPSGVRLQWISDVVIDTFQPNVYMEDTEYRYNGALGYWYDDPSKYDDQGSHTSERGFGLRVIKDVDFATTGNCHLLNWNGYGPSPVFTWDTDADKNAADPTYKYKHNITTDWEIVNGTLGLATNQPGYKKYTLTIPAQKVSNYGMNYVYQVPDEGAPNGFYLLQYYNYMRPKNMHSITDAEIAQNDEYTFDATVANRPATVATYEESIDHEQDAERKSYWVSNDGNCRTYENTTLTIPTYVVTDYYDYTIKNYLNNHFDHGTVTHSVTDDDGAASTVSDKGFRAEDFHVVWEKEIMENRYESSGGEGREDVTHEVEMTLTSVARDFQLGVDVSGSFVPTAHPEHVVAWELWMMPNRISSVTDSRFSYDATRGSSVALNITSADFNVTASQSVRPKSDSTADNTALVDGKCPNSASGVTFKKHISKASLESIGNTYTENFTFYVKAYYSDDSGLEPTFHAMESLPVTTTGVLDVTAAQGEAVDHVEYFTPQGLRVDNPSQSGIYLRVIVLKNGQHRAEKVKI